MRKFKYSDGDVVGNLEIKGLGGTSKLMQTVLIGWLNLSADQTVQALMGRRSADDPHNQALSNYLFGKVNQL